MTTELRTDQLLVAYELILDQAAQTGRAMPWKARKALRGLATVAPPALAAWCNEQGRPSDPNEISKGQPRSVLVAPLTDDQIDSAYKARLALGKRGELPDLVRHVPPPAHWRPQVMELLLTERYGDIGMPLAAMDEPLAHHTTVDREQSAMWYLRTLVTLVRPALAVASECPRWMASLHPPDELERIAELIARHAPADGS